jgi:hypothetical protein
MKKIFLLITTLIIFNSCTTNDVKEISGTLIFNDFGSHIFNINADNIEATIIMVGPNNGESIVLQNVPLYRTVDYNAKIGVNSSKSLKTELLSNLVVMYEVKSGKSISNDFKNTADSGYIKIDWKGIN